MNEDQKDKLETTVARRFVGALGGGWKLLARDGPQSRPDFRLQNGDRIVGLELARYREQDSRNCVAELDGDFQQFMHDQWIDDPEVHHCGLCLIYRREGNRILVPPRSCWGTVHAELREFVQRLGRPPIPCEFRFELYEREDQEYLEFVARHRGPILSKRQFPALCRWFSLIGAHWHPNLIVGLPHTSGSSGCTGADTRELERVIRGKMAKAATYRANLPQSAELWLLLYNEGWPATAHISNEVIMGRLLDSAQAVLGAAGAFDRAFWHKDAYVQPVGPLLELDFRAALRSVAG